MEIPVVDACFKHAVMIDRYHWDFPFIIELLINDKDTGFPEM